MILNDCSVIVFGLFFILLLQQYISGNVFRFIFIFIFRNTRCFKIFEQNCFDKCIFFAGRQDQLSVSSVILFTHQAAVAVVLRFNNCIAFAAKH